MRGYLDDVPVFKAGDPKPASYLERYEWAEAQRRGGRRQRQCPVCGLWRFQQETCEHRRPGLAPEGGPDA